MRDLVVALGLVAVIEGVFYAAAPGQMKRLLAQVESFNEQTMRMAGLAAMAAGVLIVWLARG